MGSSGYALVLGDRNYSSWSLRPWLLLRMFEIAFDEIDVDIYSTGARDRILAHVPSGKVPALKADGLTIWDSLAIIEYVAETHPELPIWPRDKNARAVARAVSAEMHSGFENLRSQMPMDLNSDKPVKKTSDDVARDLKRIVEIWRMCRSEYGTDGPFLFGEFSAADAMYAPVTSRFRTYGIDLSQFGDDGTAAAYCDTILSLDAVRDWAKKGHEQLAQRRRHY